MDEDAVIFKSWLGIISELKHNSFLSNEKCSQIYIKKKRYIYVSFSNKRIKLMHSIYILFACNKWCN